MSIVYSKLRSFNERGSWPHTSSNSIHPPYLFLVIRPQHTGLPSMVALKIVHACCQAKVEVVHRDSVYAQLEAWLLPRSVNLGSARVVIHSPQI